MPRSRDLDARLSLVLEALCAITEAMPPEPRAAIGAKLSYRLSRRSFDPSTDVAVSADLARLLTHLGCMPIETPSNKDTV